MNTREKTTEKVIYKEKASKYKELILYNDEVNTFDHVIQTLIYACNHTSEQAEQCAIIVHYNGKCTVKTGTRESLKPCCSMLLEAGLSAEIL